MSPFPYVGVSIMRYNSPHSTDLSFDADQHIRVLGPAPDVDDWVVGENIHTGQQGIFPKEFVVETEEESVSSSIDPAPSTEEPAVAADATVDQSTPSHPILSPEPIAIPSKSADEIARTPSPPPENSPPIEDTPHVLKTPLLEEQVVLGETPAPLSVARPISPPPAPSEVATPTPAEAAPAPVASIPIHKAASPTPLPPSSPPPSAVKVGGMSASDAKESIKVGGSLKDRMAMFQQNAAPAAPVPIPARAKPTGNWAWKNKVATAPIESPSHTSSEQAPGSSESAPVVAQTSSAAPPSQRGTMSASDAKESITKGGSLKERMAALQGKMGGAAPVPPPVPSGKPRVWKRPEALVAPVAEVEQDEKKKSKWVVEGVSKDELDGGVVKSGEDFLEKEPGDAPVVAPENDAEGLGEKENEPEAEAPVEEDEDAADRARRAAIAARMAKLGGRGIFGGPPPAPIPAAVRQQSVDPSEDKPVNEASSVPEESTGTSSSNVGDEAGSTLAAAPLPAMPRRAAPPRRKAPANPKATDPIPNAPNPQEVPEPKTAEQAQQIKLAESLALGEDGKQGAEQVGIALKDTDEGDQMVDQPLVGQKQATEQDVPSSEEAQIGLTKPGSEREARVEETSIVAGVEDLSIEDQARASEAGVPQRKPSIPLPDRESHDLTDKAEFRHEVETPSDIGPAGGGGSGEGLFASTVSAASSLLARAEEAVGLKGEDSEKHDLVKDIPEHVPAPMEADDAGSGEEGFDEPEAPPPPPRRALPPRVVDLGKAEEGAETEEEGLGHEETEPVASPPPPPKRTSLLPPLPVAPALSSDEELEQGVSSAAEEAADAREEEGEEDEGEGVYVQEDPKDEEEAPAPPPRRPLVPITTHDFPPVSEEPVSPSATRQRPAVPLPHIPASLPVQETLQPTSPISTRSSIHPSAPYAALPSLPTTDNNPLGSFDSAPSAAPHEPVGATEPSEDDTEAARRQSIAARMAKLGGPNQFRLFGGPPIGAKKLDPEVSKESRPEEEKGEGEMEEDDEVRRARARAKMASMGGMRMGGFGMAQPVGAVPSQEDQGVIEEHEDQAQKEEGQAETVEEGSVQEETVERNEEAVAPTEENYHFEVPSFETATSPINTTFFSSEPEELPPPPPARPQTRGLPAPPVSTPSTVSVRPPAPPARKSSIKRFSGVFNQRKSSDGGRPVLENLDASSVQYASQSLESAIPESSEPLARAAPVAQAQVSSADLVRLSKDSGATVFRNTESLMLQSKRATIADGTSLGFVQEALYMSHCQPPTESNTSFGHLVFDQSGKSVVTHRDDIRPGDVVVIENAYFRGKKALGHYSTDIVLQHGVALEFEARKSKARIAQVGEHTHSHPTLESVSYKLDDLQSGSIKVFRAFA